MDSLELFFGHGPKHFYTLVFPYKNEKQKYFANLQNTFAKFFASMKLSGKFSISGNLSVSQSFLLFWLIINHTPSQIWNLYFLVYLIFFLYAFI